MTTLLPVFDLDAALDQLEHYIDYDSLYCLGAWQLLLAWIESTQGVRG